MLTFVCSAWKTVIYSASRVYMGLPRYHSHREVRAEVTKIVPRAIVSWKSWTFPTNNYWLSNLILINYINYIRISKRIVTEIGVLCGYSHSKQIKIKIHRNSYFVIFSDSYRFLSFHELSDQLNFSCSYLFAYHIFWDFSECETIHESSDQLNCESPSWYIVY